MLGHQFRKGGKGDRLIGSASGKQEKGTPRKKNADRRTAYHGGEKKRRTLGKRGIPAHSRPCAKGVGGKGGRPLAQPFSQKGWGKEKSGSSV